MFTDPRLTRILVIDTVSLFGPYIEGRVMYNITFIVRSRTSPIIEIWVPGQQLLLNTTFRGFLIIHSVN